MSTAYLSGLWWKGLEYLRSFIAIDIEDQQLLSKLIEIQLKIAATGADVKLVERENIHLTLRFLGEISRGMVDDVINVLRGLNASSFKVKLFGVGAFPRIQRPRVIWVGISEGVEALKSIYLQLEGGLRRIGFKPEKEGFSPHITLARVRSWRGVERLANSILSLQAEEVGEVLVQQVKLKKSVLTVKGPIYTDLYVQTLT